MIEALPVSCWAPWSPSLWLRKDGPSVSLVNDAKCRIRGYHCVRNVSNSVGRCGSMKWDVYHCETCDHYFDGAYFESTTGLGIKDRLPYRIKTEEKQRATKI